MPNTQYHNFGRSGAGQQFIVAQLSQVLNHYKPGPNDLVAIMWSTFFREDRYLYGRKHQNWSTPGNIFTAQHEVPPEFVEKYVCTRGMLVRDLSLVDITMRMMQQSAFDCFATLACPIEHQAAASSIDAAELLPPVDDVVALYRDVERLLVPSMMHTQFKNGWRKNCYKYWDDDLGDINEDYHPSVDQYLDYLKDVGMQPSVAVMEKVITEHQKMLGVTNKNQLRDYKPCLIL